MQMGLGLFLNQLPGATFNINTVPKSVWYSAIGSTVGQSAGKVTSISDLSGNSKNLTLGSGGTNECTYSNSYALANNFPAFIFSNTSNNTYFRASSTVMQDIFVVCAYKDGQQGNFDGFQCLMSGTGTFNVPRLGGSTGAQFFSGFASQVTRNRGTSITNIMVQGMGMAVYRFTAPAPVTDNFFFFGGSTTAKAWEGHICEFIGLPSTTDATTALNIQNYLLNKYSILQNTLNLVFVGQSLAAGTFTNASSNFITEGFVQGFTDVKLINGGKISAAVLFQADNGAGAFLDSTNTAEGADFANPLVSNVVASGIAWQDINVAAYLIGNTDANALESGTITEAQHKAGYKTLIDLVRARAPNAIHMAIPNLGDTTQSSTLDQNSWTAIKRAQYQDHAENPYILSSFGTWDIPRVDGIHPTVPGYVMIAQRLARLAAHHLNFGSPNNPLGASITSATFDPAADSITVVTAFDPNGDAINYTMSDAHHFVVYVNGSSTALVPGTIVKNTIHNFTLSGGSLAFSHGDNVIIGWPGGTSSDMIITDIFLDDATNILPLQPRFDLIATESP